MPQSYKKWVHLGRKITHECSDGVFNGEILLHLKRRKKETENIELLQVKSLIRFYHPPDMLLRDTKYRHWELSIV